MKIKDSDTSIIEKFDEEAKKQWGDTREWSEFEKNFAGRSEKDLKNAADKMMNIFSEIGSLKQLAPDDPAVREKIASLQRFISENFYDCTDKIFSVLGKMYVSDGRFKENIDKAGGPGAARFVSEAIESYLQHKKEFAV